MDRIEHIPVMLGSPIHGSPIGFGSIAEDGRLHITITAGVLVEQIHNLLSTEQIREIYLSFGFPAALEGETKRGRPE